jgi:hypothetical protein
MDRFRLCLVALVNRCHGVIRSEAWESFKKYAPFVSLCICNFFIPLDELT